MGKKKFFQAVVPKGTFSKGGSAAGNALGKLVGGRKGGKLGRMLGGAAGDFLSSIVGFGDYEVRQNTLAKGGAALPMGSPVPKFTEGGQKVRICHREFVSNVVVGATPAAFENREFLVCPTNAQMFPWLSSIAENFQQWRLLGAVAIFVSNTSGYSASGPLGQLVLASNYDVNDIKYGSVAEALNSEFAVQAAPSVNQVHAFECDPALRPYEWMYTSGGEQATGSVADLRLENLCRFQLITEGLPGSTGDVLGGLWISYDVELCKPVANAVVGQYMSDAVVTKTDLFNNYANEGITYFTGDGMTLTCVVGGSYLIAYTVVGTGSPTASLAGVTGTAVAIQSTSNTTESTYYARIYGDTGDTWLFTGAGTTVDSIVVTIAPFTIDTT